MSKAQVALSSLLLFALGALSSCGAEKQRTPYIDLTGDFTRFFDETAGMEESSRVELFRKQAEQWLPGFYVPRFGATEEQFNARIARRLNRFAELRPKYEQAQKDFPAAFDAGIEHFRKEFPGFTPDVPIYLLHSLGEMDGGTRELNGKTVLIFGADVIADIHQPDEITPFLDHELFHVEHQKHFTSCEEVWCLLWTEGLATYAALKMNPGADDRQLLLTFPKPIRADVDANWSAALCFTRDRLSSAEAADVHPFFVGGTGGTQFPERFGYYIGLRVAEEAGGGYKLAELARMPPERAKAALTASLDRMIEKAGDCPRPEEPRAN